MPIECGNIPEVVGGGARSTDTMRLDTMSTEDKIIDNRVITNKAKYKIAKDYLLPALITYRAEARLAKSKRSFSINCGGMCSYVATNTKQNRVLTVDLLQKVFMLWPEYSGSSKLPIDERSYGTSYRKANRDGTMLSGSYGQARRRLARFLVETLKQEIARYEQQA